MRVKLISIVAILWVAAVGAISVAFAASRDEHYSPGNFVNGQFVPGTYSSEFSWGGWLAWTGVATLVAVVMLAIVLVMTIPKKGA